MKSPVQGRSRVSTERMLVAALGILDRGGLKALTVENVTRESQTSSGAIYHRFGNRDGLVAATLDHFLSQFELQMGEGLARVAEISNDAEAVHQLVELWLATFAVNRQRFRAFMVEGHEQAFLYDRGRQASHAMARQIGAWLEARFGCGAAMSQTCYRLLLGLGASRALWDPEQVTETPLGETEFSREVGSAILRAVSGQP